ncbi:MAG: inositol monophosphatase family protein [Sulfuricella sp.]|nr:inositol monophosphatase family protein [Sulfuricella sp.]
MLTAVIEAVKTVARQEIMPRYLKVAHQRKTDGSVFTEADIAAQTALIAALRKICDCPVLGEEMAPEQQEALWREGDRGMWCIDPIDGTSNFVNGLPYFAVSVALMRQGESVLGVVYDPVADEMFWAERGKGAFLNGVPLPIKERAPELRHAMAAIDFKRLDPKLAQRLVAAPPFASQRNFGASTLDWCYVAAGRLALYLHGGQKLWDYAAGSLILAEAGGAMCTLGEDDFQAGDPWQRSVIAALNPDLFAQWKSWIRKNQ